MSPAECLYNLFIVAVIIAWCANWLLYFGAFIWCHIKMNKRKSNFESQSLVGVSILKPLCGFDSNLKSNLETYFTLNYSPYEILFCVQDGSDPAVKIVEALLQQYPSVDAKLFIGGKQVGINPKINNMQLAYEVAQEKYPLVLISDSGVRMKTDTLLNMVSTFTPNVGLVHQLPYTTERDTLASIREQIFFGTFHAKPYLTADCLGVNCVNGMSCLIRKEALNKIGDLKAFGHYLAEDFFITQAILDNGWKISLCDEPAWQNSGLCMMSVFNERITRWTKLRFAMVPHIVVLEFCVDCLFQGLGVAYVMGIFFDVDFFLAFLAHLILWCLADWCLLRSIHAGPLKFSTVTYVLMWLCQTFSAPTLLVQALLTCRTIKWKNETFHLLWGGKVEGHEPIVNRPIKNFSDDFKVLIP